MENIDSSVHECGSDYYYYVHLYCATSTVCNVSVKLNQRRSVDQVPLVEGLSKVISFKSWLERLYGWSAANVQWQTVPNLRCQVSKSSCANLGPWWNHRKFPSVGQWAKCSTRGADADSRVQVTWFTRLVDFKCYCRHFEVNPELHRQPVEITQRLRDVDSSSLHCYDASECWLNTIKAS